VPACVRWREKALGAPKRDCAQRSALWAIASADKKHRGQSDFEQRENAAIRKAFAARLTT